MQFIAGGCMRLVDKIEQEISKFSHARDPYCVGMREGMGEAADYVLAEVHRVVLDLEREASNCPQLAEGIKRALEIIQKDSPLVLNCA